MTPEERANLRRRIDEAKRRIVERREVRRFCVECGELQGECSCEPEAAMVPARGSPDRLFEVD